MNSDGKQTIIRLAFKWYIYTNIHSIRLISLISKNGIMVKIPIIISKNNLAAIFINTSKKINCA